MKRSILPKKGSVSFLSIEKISNGFIILISNENQEVPKYHRGTINGVFTLLEHVFDKEKIEDKERVMTKKTIKTIKAERSED